MALPILALLPWQQAIIIHNPPILASFPKKFSIRHKKMFFLCHKSIVMRHNSSARLWLVHLYIPEKVKKNIIVAITVVHIKTANQRRLTRPTSHCLAALCT
jgi:hypothetical protein